MHAGIHKYVRRYVHTYIHTYIHTFIHPHIPTYSFVYNRLVHSTDVVSEGNYLSNSSIIYCAGRNDFLRELT